MLGKFDTPRPLLSTMPGLSTVFEYTGGLKWPREWFIGERLKHG